MNGLSFIGTEIKENASEEPVMHEADYAGKPKPRSRKKSPRKTSPRKKVSRNYEQEDKPPHPNDIDF